MALFYLVVDSKAKSSVGRCKEFLLKRAGTWRMSSGSREALG